MTESTIKEGKRRGKESNNHVINDGGDVDMTEKTKKKGKRRGKREQQPCHK